MSIGFSISVPGIRVASDTLQTRRAVSRNNRLRDISYQVTPYPFYVQFYVLCFFEEMF
jgi:hypothetical protein